MNRDELTNELGNKMGNVNINEPDDYGHCSACIHDSCEMNEDPCFSCTHNRYTKKDYWEHK